MVINHVKHSNIINWVTGCTKAIILCQRIKEWRMASRNRSSPLPYVPVSFTVHESESSFTTGYHAKPCKSFDMHGKDVWARGQLTRKGALWQLVVTGWTFFTRISKGITTKWKRNWVAWSDMRDVSWPERRIRILRSGLV